MYGYDSTGQSSNDSNGDNSMFVLIGGAGLLATTAYYAPGFFCPPVSAQELEKKRKIAELSKDVKEQSTQQLEEINQLKEALFKFKEDEAAYIEIARTQNPEIFRVAQNINHLPPEIAAKEVDKKDKEMNLAQLLNTYPELPEKGQRSYEAVKRYYEDNAEHHSQVLELANIVLSEGYRRIQYNDNRESNSQLMSLLS